MGYLSIRVIIIPRASNDYWKYKCILSKIQSTTHIFSHNFVILGVEPD